MPEQTKEQIQRMRTSDIVRELRRAARYEREHIGITFEHGWDIINLVAIHGEALAGALENWEHA